MASLHRSDKQARQADSGNSSFVFCLPKLLLTTSRVSDPRKHPSSAFSSAFSSDAHPTSENGKRHRFCFMQTPLAFCPRQFNSVSVSQILLMAGASCWSKGTNRPKLLPSTDFCLSTSSAQILTYIMCTFPAAPRQPHVSSSPSSILRRAATVTFPFQSANLIMSLPDRGPETAPSGHSSLFKQTAQSRCFLSWAIANIKYRQSLSAGRKN